MKIKSFFKTHKLFLSFLLFLLAFSLFLMFFLRMDIDYYWHFKAGEYMVSPYHSAKFADNYVLEDVPGRSYILIHKGKLPGHTSGCLLSGESYVLMEW